MTGLSVIISVYNTEKYLKKCLESILCQNFPDFEVICVNDGSTDSSSEILNSYRDIKVINIQNSGSGVARNTGLEYAKGEYVLFVDSDDMMAKGAFKKLLFLADKLNPDILIFGALTCVNGRLRTGGYSINKIPRKYLNTIFNKSDFKGEIFKFPSTAWTKLYKKTFLIKNDIKFQEIKAGQDQLFFVHAMLAASSIGVLNENLYYYQKRRPGSVTSLKKKTSFSPLYVFEAVEKLQCDYTYREVILGRYFLKATLWLSKMREDLKAEYYARYLSLLERVKRDYPYMWWKYLSVNCPDSYILLRIKCFIAAMMCNINRINFKKTDNLN